MSKYLDNDGLLYLWQKLKNKFATITDLNDKVDKVDGKGLSTNDYTTTEKNKLSGIASGAQVNVIETIKVNSTALTPSSKAVDITVPTKTSDITNDSGFITSASVPAATTTSPKMNGTAAVGTETKWAKGDHVHPSDTSRVPTSRTVAGHALSSDVTLAKADVGLGNVDNTADADKPVSTAQQTALDEKVDKVTGKGLSTNDYTTAEKNKLSGIATGAEVNQNAFSNVKVGNTTVAADAKTDTLEFVAGSNVTITPDTTNDKITIAATDTTYSAATSSSNGLMTSAQYTKLEALPDNATLASTYALKTDITSMYKYKGSVATVAALPSTGQTVGDVYNVEATGMNYAWDGTAWDALGEIFTITSISNSDIDTIVAT